jgi:hypothetical protein
MGIVYANIKLKRGARKNLPVSAPYGEPIFTGDSHELFIGTGAGTPLVNVTRAMSTLVFCFRTPQDGQKSNKLVVPFVKDIHSMKILMDYLEPVSATIELYVNGSLVKSATASGELTNVVFNDVVSLVENDIVHTIIRGNLEKLSTATVQVNAQ